MQGIWQYLQNLPACPSARPGCVAGLVRKFLAPEFLAPLQLGPIHPNPSRGGAEIPFSLARSGGVRLALFDMAGRRVRSLLDRIELAGTHRVAWDGRGDNGQLAPAGVYVVRCESAGRSETRRIQLLR